MEGENSTTVPTTSEINAPTYDLLEERDPDYAKAFPPLPIQKLGGVDSYYGDPPGRIGLTANETIYMNHLSSTAKTTTGSGNEGLAKASQNAEVTPPTTRSPSKEKAKQEFKPSYANVAGGKAAAQKVQLSWAEEANEEATKNPEQQRRSTEAHVAAWVTTQERQTAEASEAHEQEAQDTQVAEAVAGAALRQEMPESCINETNRALEQESPRPCIDGTNEAHEHAPPRCYAHKATQVSEDELFKSCIEETNAATYREADRTRAAESDAEAPGGQVRQPLVNEVNEATNHEEHQLQAPEEDKASEWKTVLNKSTWGAKQGKRKATADEVTNEAEVETPQDATAVAANSPAPEEKNVKQNAEVQDGAPKKRKQNRRRKKTKAKSKPEDETPLIASSNAGDSETKEATEQDKQVEEKQQAWTIVPPTLRYWIERARQWVAATDSTPLETNFEELEQEVTAADPSAQEESEEPEQEEKMAEKLAQEAKKNKRKRNLQNRRDKKGETKA